MSRTRGEGRSSAEKSGRLLEDPAATRERRNARRREEEEWAARSGPVETRHVHTAMLCEGGDYVCATCREKVPAPERAWGA